MTKPLITQTALAVLDDEGLDGLTLRRIADRLGVKAPALYWHFPDKKALVDEMATELMRRSQDAPIDTADWRELISQSSRGLRALLRSHRDGARVFSGSRLTDVSVAAGMERPLRLLIDSGFTERDAKLAWTTMRDLVVGFVIEEQEVYLADGSPRPEYDAAERARQLDPARHPLAARSGPTSWGSPDERFDDVIRFLIDGMAARLDQP